MKVAGKVAIVFKGEYSIDAVYEKLNSVRYNGSLYVAKKPNTGILPTDTEHWILALESTKGTADSITYDNTGSNLEAENVQAAIDEIVGDYVKKTDYAVAATEDSPGIPGIVQPDGKTIKVSEDGILTGASIGFTGTKAEYLEAVENGEIEPGMTVFITDDFTAPAGSKIRIGEKDEIEAAVEAGEIEDGTIVFITDDYVEPAVVTPEEIQEVKEQASNAVETANKAIPDISGDFNANTVGWYRLFKIDEFSSCFDFDLNLLRNYNTGAAGDCLKAHINMVYSVPTYKVSFDQISSRQRGFYLRQVRVVEDRREGTSKGIYIDVKYNASTLNRVFAKIQNYNMTEGKVWPQFIGEFVDDEEENEKLAYHIFEPVNTVGIIADKAITVDPAVFTNHTIANRIRVTTKEEVDMWLDNIYENCPDHSAYEGELDVKAEGIFIGGGLWHITGYRDTDQYGYQEAKSYTNTSKNRYYSRSRYEGSWTEWGNMVP